MITIHNGLFDVDDFCKIYSSVGWEEPNKEQVKNALQNSAYIVYVKDSGKIVGMGRIIGDQAMSFMLKDIVVMPEYQRRGIGTTIVEKLIAYIKETTPYGDKVCVELFSGNETEGFYKKFGFSKREDGFAGYGMMTMLEGIKPNLEV